MNVLISACLLGIPCRYDGKEKTCPKALELLQKHTCIPICPEQLGGLPTPRPPAERRDGGVYTREGRDVTKEYCRGAKAVLEMAKLLNCRTAVLKEGSPSCGKGVIHDGTFSGGWVAGNGVAVDLLSENGICVYGESELEKLL